MQEIAGHFRKYHRAPWFLYPVAAFLLAFAIGPLLALLKYSFYQKQGYQMVKTFSLATYHEVLTTPLYLFLTGKSVLYALIVSAVTLAAGYPTAQFLTWRAGRMKSLLLMALLIPLYTGDLIRIYAWRIILGLNGALNTLLLETGVIDAPISALLFSNFSVLISLVYIYLPFMILPIWANLEGLDRGLVEASMDLGAGRFRTFSRVVLPLTVPGIFAGMLLVFIPVTGEFLSPNLLGGASGVTVMNVITSQFGTAFNWPLGSALAWFLLLVVAAVIALLIYLVTRQRWMRQSAGAGI